MIDRHDELMKLAFRLWTAQEHLDALNGGGERVWRWTHRQVARLTREDRQEDVEVVRELVHVVEERLEMERESRQEVEA